VHFPRNQSIRAVLRWQLYAAVIIAAIAALRAGPHGAISAVLGGWVSLSAGAAYAWLAGAGTGTTGTQTLRTLIRAEASKIALIVIQLWLVLTTYKSVVLLAFFSTFVITTLIFGMAVFVSDKSATQDT
jgi:ATP synthase protein I